MPEYTEIEKVMRNIVANLSTNEAKHILRTVHSGIKLTEVILEHPTFSEWFSRTFNYYKGEAGSIVESYLEGSLKALVMHLIDNDVYYMSEVNDRAGV